MSVVIKGLGVETLAPLLGEETEISFERGDSEVTANITSYHLGKTVIAGAKLKLPVGQEGFQAGYEGVFQQTFSIASPALVKLLKAIRVSQNERITLEFKPIANPPKVSVKGEGLFDFAFDFPLTVTGLRGSTIASLLADARVLGQYTLSVKELEDVVRTILGKVMKAKDTGDLVFYPDGRVSFSLMTSAVQGNVSFARCFVPMSSVREQVALKVPLASFAKLAEVLGVGGLAGFAVTRIVDVNGTAQLHAVLEGQSTTLEVLVTPVSEAAVIPEKELIQEVAEL